MDATNKAVPDEFAEYVRANYIGVIDIHAPDWHAKRLWNAAMRALAAAPSQPAAVSAPSDERADFDLHGTGVKPWSQRIPPNSPLDVIAQAMQAELSDLTAAIIAARAAAPVSVQGASIDTPEFQALLPADMTQWKRQEICQFIDSRPRCEDSRAKVLEEAAAICDAKYTARSYAGLPREASAARACRDEIRALASTPPKADNE